LGRKNNALLLEDTFMLALDIIKQSILILQNLSNLYLDHVSCYFINLHL